MEDILVDAIEAANITINEINLKRKRPVILDDQSPMTMESFAEHFRKKLGKKYKNHQEAFDCSLDEEQFVEAVKVYARNKKILAGEKSKPESLAEYTLNLDMASDPPKFFVTTKDEYLSAMSGAAFMAVTGMKHEDAINEARHVFMDYDPHGSRGVSTLNTGKEEKEIFNTYIPPTWHGHENLKLRNPKIHPLFLQCIQHVFPIKKERQFFYAWLYTSLFKRSPTYLILCGNAGLGKNRIKLLVRALHGHENTPDGKRSSLTERFNSQVEGATAIWFDELNFNEQIENILKEMQNETLSIEKKGVDASRSTKIFASMVISNNYPRNNYIQFDSRKFVPLVLAQTKLGESMKHRDIDRLTKMIEFPDHELFDPGALAEFVCWLKKNGPRLAERFPNLEYKGPAFYRLAHTTMSRWQIAIISFMLSERLKASFVTDNKELGVKWSTLEPAIRRTLYKGYSWPHPETIKRFLEIYCSLDGEQGFKITPIKTGVSDFYIKVLVGKLKTTVEELAQSDAVEEEESDIHLL